MIKATSDQKRRILWINPYFQSRFLLLTLATTLLIVGVGMLSNWLFIWKFIEFGNTSGLPEGHDYYRFIYKQEATLNFIFLASSTLIIIGSSIYGLIMSNKIAGPIYRIQKDLEKQAAGHRIERLHVREGDFFQELAVTINQTLIDSRNKRSSSTSSKKTGMKTGIKKAA